MRPVTCVSLLLQLLYQCAFMDQIRILFISLSLCHQMLKKSRFLIFFTISYHNSRFFLLDIVIIGISYHILRLVNDFWTIYELFQTVTLPKD